MKNLGKQAYYVESNDGRATMRRWSDAEKFVEFFSDFWLANKAENSAFLRLGAKPAMGDSFYISMHNELGEVQQTAYLNPLDQIIVSNAPERVTKALCIFLAENRLEVPGIFAPTPTGEFVAKMLGKLTDRDYWLVKEMLHLELLQSLKSRIVEGSFQLAERRDFEELVLHRKLLQDESNTQRPFDSALSVENDLRDMMLYCWIDNSGSIVASGSLYHDKSPTSSYMNHIYVPPYHRRQGFAFALIHKLCELAIDRKKTPSLSVDAANEPAYQLYLKMGFVVVARMSNFRR